MHQGSLERILVDRFVVAVGGDGTLADEAMPIGALTYSAAMRRCTVLPGRIQHDRLLADLAAHDAVSEAAHDRFLDQQKA